MTIETTQAIRELFEQSQYKQICQSPGRHQNLDDEARLLVLLSRAFLGEGETISQEIEILVKTPGHTLFMQSAQGLAALMLGDIQRAKTILEPVIKNSEARAVEYGRWGAVNLARMNLETACQAYQEAVLREPGRAEWHNNLAGILVRQQKFEQALENYDIALSIKPDLPQAVDSRQKVLMTLDRTDEVVRAQEKAFQDHPDQAEHRWQLARAYALDNRLEDAFKLLRQHLVALAKIKELKPDSQASDESSATAFSEQCGTLRLMAELAQTNSRYLIAQRALNWLNQVLDDDQRVPVLVQLAQIHVEQEQFEQAQAQIDEAVTLSGEGPHHGLDMVQAQILSAKGDFAGAETILRDLLKIYPGDARVLTQLGQVLLWIGRLDEAGDCFEQASRINPTALASMVNAKKMPDHPEAIHKMKTLADNPLLAKPTRISMGFALAEVFDKKQDHDQGFTYLAKANQLTDQGLKYDPTSFTQRVDAIKSVFDADYLTSLPSIRQSDRTPIFVVGMPRSGTTLTEQILASHEQIFGAGELSLLAKLTQLMPRVLKMKKSYPSCMPHMTPHLREEAARYYLTGLMAYDTIHPYVVDKMPHNFMNLGLIAAILPKAKIIHIQRDPRDTALSNFQQNFKAKHGGMGFAFDLVKIAYQLNDYYRMMAHWRKVLPIPMLEITYEELVADQEGQSRRLLDFVGVAWDEHVKDFHKTERAVRTASVAQVRQPIYQTSRRKWEKYADHLAPLLDHLEPDILTAWDRRVKDMAS